jgi:hypothetical protein
MHQQESRNIETLSKWNSKELQSIFIQLSGYTLLADQTHG